MSMQLVEELQIKAQLKEKARGEIEEIKVILEKLQHLGPEYRQALALVEESLQPEPDSKVLQELCQRS